MYVSKLVSLGLLLYWKGPTMSAAQPIILAIFVALCIYMGSATQEESIYDPTPEMLINQVKKTKDGWFCAGVLCPKDVTYSCKTTTILKPTLHIEHDLVVLCLNATNYPFCGVTRSSRVIIMDIIETTLDGTQYVKKDRLTTREGVSIPYCPIKTRNKKG